MSIIKERKVLMRQNACCLIGHENLKGYNRKKIMQELEAQIESLIKDDVKVFYSNCTPGFEMIGALKILRMRKKYPQIKLYLIIRYKNKCAGWSKADLELYEHIQAKADEVYYELKKDDETIAPECKSIINYADYVLAAWNGEESNRVGNAVLCARIFNKQIIFLNMNDSIKFCYVKKLASNILCNAKCKIKKAKMRYRYRYVY